MCLCSASAVGKEAEQGTEFMSHLHAWLCDSGVVAWVEGRRDPRPESVSEETGSFEGR